MKSFTEKIRSLFKWEAMKPLPRVNQKKEVLDPVYHFFVNESSTARKRSYDRALKAAEVDQKEIIEKYERIQKDMVSA